MVINKKINLIFMGSSEFSVPILLKLIKNFNILAVVTEMDKAMGRHKNLIAPCTKVLAQENNLSFFQPLSLKNNPKFHEELRQLNPELIVVAAYGKILPRETLNLAPHGCLNVHPSLLPKYRGASPIQTAILNGDSMTGASIILMDAGMDTGDIVVQTNCPIDKADDYPILSQKLSELSAELLVKNIPAYLDGTIKLRIQNDDKATYCYEINKTDGRIDWRASAQEIFNQLRAFSKWPGVYTLFNKRKLDIIKAMPAKLNQSKKLQVGSVLKVNGRVYVKCGQDYLRLEEVKIEGKQACPIDQFINGYQQFVDSILD